MIFSLVCNLNCTNCCFLSPLMGLLYFNTLYLHQEQVLSMEGTMFWPDLDSLHWLPVKSRIEFKILLLTFKALNNMAPLYLKELIVPYQPTRALRSQNSSLLVVPTVSKSRVGARAFSYQACGIISHFQLGRQTPSVRLRVRLKPSFAIKLIVRAGTGLS